ncbi:MAG: DUF4294 domain-containing protein [Chitinophagales bacterium]|nr:DUF4294 domain-containing protein [Chitinophagales bacterium]MCO5281599.1 DUF4294 domain-containing protein [Chitinophagales bacterium]OJV27770.1 MAG: hypothetical protein BGO32_10970 [Bacteroidetes bacterium 37-13]HRN94530.1 DUF4294 domain-containing protein [Chitinophagales bacterium]HRP38463.1 DUF4294 domain-containing protein [Chitinophagales bacterium]
MFNTLQHTKFNMNTSVRSLFLAFYFACISSNLSAQIFKSNDTIPLSDTMQTYYLPEVDIVNFKTDDEWREYYQTYSRVKKVMPYVKIANQLYAELQNKEGNSKRSEYRHYRKDLEKEMRQKFEKELRNLSIGQGKVLVKLINRETGNNCYKIIKEVKGGFNAFVWQIVAKRYDYNLKENYDPQKEKMIELVIKQLGKEYNVAVK